MASIEKFKDPNPYWANKNRKARLTIALNILILKIQVPTWKKWNFSIFIFMGGA